MDAAENYAELFEAALGTVYGVVSPSLRHNQAEDIAQQAVIEYREAVERGVEVRNPHAFVRTVAKRRAIDAWRRWRRRKGREQPGDDEDVFFEALTQSLQRITSPSSAALAAEEQEWIDGMIDSLFPDEVDRAIAHGCVMQGRAPRDLAEETGLAAKTISNRLVRVKDVLEAHLDPMRKETP